jgi:hypothetical protein
MTCDECKDLMPGALYGELAGDESGRFDEHLASCSLCAREMTGLRTTLEIMSRRQRPGSGEDAWAAWDERLNERLRAASPAGQPQKRNIPVRTPVRVPSWSYGIAALLVLAVGIYLGRSWFGRQGVIPPAEQASTLPSAAPSDSISRAALEYLERSRNVLLGVINTADSSGVPAGFDHQQRISRDLVRQAVTLKTALNGSDQRQLRKLIEDLEVVLVQLANIQVRPGVPVVELVRQGVDRRSILLKINLEEMKTKNGLSDEPGRNSKSHL